MTAMGRFADRQEFRIRKTGNSAGCWMAFVDG
jgi:hypothetical protein